MRKTKFQVGGIYHIFNRGVDKREIFISKHDYQRFFTGLKELNTDKVIGSLYELNFIRKRESKLPPGSLASRGKVDQKFVDIQCYALLPNHYHLIVKELIERGVERFFHKLSTSYTKYFNQKFNRTGSLFQGPFKSVEVETDEQLLYLSSYINGNAEIHNVSSADDWPWSSYSDYIGTENQGLVNKKPILREFKNTNGYRKYTKDVIRESAARKDEVKLFEV